MIEEEQINKGSQIGGSIAAVFIATIVLVVVSIVASLVASFAHYYLPSMRMEAAAFFGGVFGGIVGVFAARTSCDAVIKSYSGKGVFAVFALLGAGALLLEANDGLGWSSLVPAGQWAAILIVRWSLFWLEEAV